MPDSAPFQKSQTNFPKIFGLHFYLKLNKYQIQNHLFFFPHPKILLERQQALSLSSNQPFLSQAWVVTGDAAVQKSSDFENKSSSACPKDDYN